MAARDVNLIKFVESALRFKIKNPSATHYNYFRFDPFIYKWAKKAFFDYGVKKNFQNLDNEAFSNELVKSFIQQDPDLKFFLDPFKIPELPEETHIELRQDIQLERDVVQKREVSYQPQAIQQVAQEPSKEEQKQEGGEGPQIPRQALENPRIPTPRISGIARGTGSMLRGGASLGGRLGGALVQVGGRALVALGGAAVAAGWPVIIAVLIVVIGLPVLFMIIHILGTSTQCPPYQPNCGALRVISAADLPPPGSIDPGAPYDPLGGNGLISCPLNSPMITNGSKEVGGHCSPSYEAKYGVCAQPGSGNYRGKETAIDATSFDKMVRVPFLQGGGNPQLWTVDEVGTPIAEYEGGGIAVGLNTQASGHQFRIRFVHLSSTPLQMGNQVSPGTPIGQYKLSPANHVHITIEEDGTFKPADLYFNLCQ